MGVAAEAHAAGLFAQAGFDVLVQYGANQPEYDLLVSRGKTRHKVSVKGSKDGGWLLAASHKRPELTYHDAIKAWVAAHADASTLYCLVQFKGLPLGTMPRVYLATVDEVARYLHAQHAGEGYLSLREHHVWKKGGAAGTTDRIPESWSFVARIEAL